MIMMDYAELNPAKYLINKISELSSRIEQYYNNNNSNSLDSVITTTALLVLTMSVVFMNRIF